MASTIADFASRLFRLHPKRPDGTIMFGREVGVTSLTTTTIVANQLIAGGVGPGKFTEHWLWRPDTASAADRQRYCTNYTSSTGTLTQAGTNYADTTATSERLFILHPDYEADEICRAIHEAVISVRRHDITPLPTRRNQDTYYIGDLTWIESPADIVKISYVPRPELGRNRYMEKWGTVSSGGVLQPDDWTIAGASATMARSTTGNRRGSYTLAITRSGTDCTVLQTVGLLDDGSSSSDGLKGETLMVVGRVLSSVASQARMRVLDGTQTLNSSYHTGGGAIEELSKQIVVSTSATTLQFGISVETSNTVVDVEEMYLLWASTVQDTNRQDAYMRQESPLDRDSYSWSQNGTLRFFAPVMGLGGQYLVVSKKPYPGFDTTRLNAGTADLDSSDAPTDVVAYGAAYFLFKSKLGANHPTTVSAQKAFYDIRDSQLFVPGAEPERRGLDLLPARLAPAARRI